MNQPEYPPFDDNALGIAARQYFQPDEGVDEMFARVAKHVASPETGYKRGSYEQKFFDLMRSKRFCPGGRVLAGAGSPHGNILNCYVQDTSPYPADSDQGNMHLAMKLALVTKGGGGNGLNLDGIPPKTPYEHNGAELYITINKSHPDYEKVKNGTYFNITQGAYETKGYRFAKFCDVDDVAPDNWVMVSDSVEGIWNSGKAATRELLNGNDVVIDLSNLRAEGTPVNGSGGTSSGPSSFAVEVFDNFGYWASLGGVRYAGPVATLRYVFAPTLRVIRQAGVRRGAGMATISADHKDIQDFITCKDLEREQAEGDISTFNISVLATDELMRSKAPILKDIADHAWQTGEPGLIFIDRVNEFNPMRETLGDIVTTNPLRA